MLTELVGAVETPSIPESSGGMIFAVALVGAILVADRVLGNGLQLMGLLALPACVAAIFVGPRRTLVVAAFQLAAGIGWGYAQGSGADLGQVLRMSGVLIGGAAAFALSSVRTELDLRLRAVTQIADLTQAAVLRPIPSVVGPAEVAVRYVSATAGARVGGDFYEVLPFAGGVRFIVGDVRGKGIGAVRLASVLVGAFRAADHDAWPLERVLSSMDAAFHRVEPDEEDFATLVLGELTTDHQLLLLNCGHPVPLLIGPDSVQQLRLEKFSPPIGLSPQARPLRRILGPGERLLLYTDGLVEARVGNRTFDLDATAAQMGTGALDHAVDRLRTDLVRFLGGRLDDDTTILLAQLNDS
jgi:serine phosphatase RsbU (regulator of sigma subunit)